jgi:DNA (cytosine-5)-methyltransferase 1
VTLFYADEVAEARQLADVVDLFAGPRGWSEGLHLLDPAARDIGVELDRWANATARAAGHLTVEADVSEVDPHDYAGARGLIASPPCQAFSAAGSGHGRKHLDALLDAIDRGEWTARPHRDPNVWLALEVGRWAEALQPEWIALEQVPAVLPIWERYAAVLFASGYRTWSGILNAADYGVPQTRRRAVLIASRSHRVDRPPPTHDEHGAAGKARWVTMADALGWPEAFRVGFPRLDDRGDSEDGYRERDWRSADQPSFTLTEKARSWSVNTGRDWEPGTPREEAQTVEATRPAPTVTGQALSWHFTRPSTTILGDPRVWPPGHKINQDDRDRLGDEEAETRYGDRAGSEATRLEIADALVLQSFRRDYPVRGTKTKQFEQIGNAVPPRLAAEILRQVFVKT